MVKRAGKPDVAGRATAPGRGRRGPDGHVAYLLRQAQVTVRNAIERELSELAVTLPQFSVMTMLDAYGQLSAAEAARLSLLTPQTMTVIVRNLARDGHITRTPDPVHGRVLRLQLTAGGRRLVKACRRRVDVVEARMEAGLSARDARLIRRWLAGLAEELAGG